MADTYQPIKIEARLRKNICRSYCMVIFLFEFDW